MILCKAIACKPIFGKAIDCMLIVGEVTVGGAIDGKSIVSGAIVGGAIISKAIIKGDGAVLAGRGGNWKRVAGACSSRDELGGQHNDLEEIAMKPTVRVGRCNSDEALGRPWRAG